MGSAKKVTVNIIYHTDHPCTKPNLLDLRRFYNQPGLGISIGKASHSKLDAFAVFLEQGSKPKKNQVSSLFEKEFQNTGFIFEVSTILSIQLFSE